MRLGYACINNTLAAEKIQVNRSMMKRTFESKGIQHASLLALQNVTDLATVIDWNIRHQIFFYRMSSDMFPWMSEYELDQLPDIKRIADILSVIGERVRSNYVRLSFHPGPFNVLASPNETVVSKTTKELRQHGEIMDMLELPRSVEAKINIHVGGAYGDKATALDRFAENFERLPETARSRLTIENDDKASMFSVKELQRVHDLVGIPVVFDYLHHNFCTGGLEEQEAFELAIATWPGDIRPVTHYSSSKRNYEDHQAVETAHADFIHGPINTYGKDVDIMLEAKAKEVALLQFRDAVGRKHLQRSQL
jgi:UV DNA damage endonuclease